MLGHDFDFQASWFDFVYPTDKSWYWVNTTHHWNMAIVALVQAVPAPKIHWVSNLSRWTLWPSPRSQTMTSRIGLVHWLKNRRHNAKLSTIDLTSYVGIVNGTESEEKGPDLKGKNDLQMTDLVSDSESSCQTSILNYGTRLRGRTDWVLFSET